MKKIIVQFLLLFLQVFSFILQGQTMNIRINQIGYYPNATKIAIVVWSNATDFEVLKVSDSTVVF
jgi:endoglucanase